MLGVLQQKVKGPPSDCSLQDRLVMCEIKLKEPADGSERKEVKQRRQRGVQQPPFCRFYSETSTTAHEPLQHRRRADVLGEAQHSYIQSPSVFKVCWDFN